MADAKKKTLSAWFGQKIIRRHRNRVFLPFLAISVIFFPKQFLQKKESSIFLTFSLLFLRNLGSQSRLKTVYWWENFKEDATYEYLFSRQSRMDKDFIPFPTPWHRLNTPSSEAMQDQAYNEPEIMQNTNYISQAWPADLHSSLFISAKSTPKHMRIQDTQRKTNDSITVGNPFKVTHRNQNRNIIISSW